jgi:hypothetical protein
MAITYELDITNMEAVPTEGNLNNVVKIIYYTYIGKETIDGKDYWGDASGAIEINAPNSDSFTPFTDLTKDQVKQWVEPKINLSSIKEYIIKTIELQKNPPTVIKSNPWGE